jgi:hypothetical protein
MDFSKVVLKKVPKNEIVIKEYKGSAELIAKPKKPTIQPEKYSGETRVALLITKV